MKTTNFGIRDVEFEMLWEFYNEISKEGFQKFLTESIVDTNNYVVSYFSESAITNPTVGKKYYFLTVHWIPQTINDTEDLKIIKIQCSKNSYTLDEISKHNIIMKDNEDNKFRLPTLVSNYAGMTAFSVLFDDEGAMKSLTQSFTKLRFLKSAGWDLRISQWMPHSGSYL